MAAHDNLNQSQFASHIARTAHNLAVGTVVASALAVGMHGQAVQERTADLASKRQAETQLMRVEGKQMLNDQLSQMTKGRDCTTKPRLSKSVMVVNSEKDNAGNQQFDKTVVREIPFKQAWDNSVKGKSYNLRFCN